MKSGFRLLQGPKGWLLTEFSNQNDPSGFLQSISAEAPCSVFSFSNICSGSPIAYSVPNPGGHTYSWSIIGGTPSATTGNSITVTWNTSGPYSIQLTETSGSCSASSINYTVSVNPSPTAPSVTNGERCGTGTVTLQASGAVAGENYKWYDALTNGTLVQTNGGSYTTASISSTTNYYVTKYNTTTLCESYPRTLVVATIQTQPVAQTITGLPNVSDVCVNGTVSATFSGGSGGVSPVDVYESSIDGSTWQPYTSGSPISSAVAGANRLQIRTRRTSAGTGCSNSAYTTMNWNTVVQPSWNTYTFPTTIICAGGQVTFSASVVNGLGGTLTWIRSVTPGGVGTTVTSPDIPPSAGTFYYRPQYVAGYGGCNLADGTETLVTVQVDPTWNVITSPVSNICIGGNVTFSATLNNAGTGTVQWVRSATSLGVGTVVTSPDAPGVGTYYYRPQYVAGYGGCNLSDGTETMVTVQVDPTWNVITPPASNICIGGKCHLLSHIE